MPGSELSVLFKGRNFLRLLGGLGVTLELSAVSIALSIVLGLLLGAVMTLRNPVTRALSRLWLETIRIVPQLVLLFVVYFGLARAFDIQLSGEAAAVIVFTFWGAGEMGDLVRGALTSIPAHQRESAAALGYLGDDTSLYGDIFDYAKTNDPSDADKSRLIAALKAISEGELDAALDVDGAISWLAANALLVNDDGYLGNMLHNYFLYELNGRLTILPWDYNLAFGGFAGGSATSAVNDPIDTPSSSERPLVTALLSDEDCLERYHNILYELAAFLTDGSMDALIDELTAMIDESVQNDPTKECTYEDYLTAIQTLRSFCALRGESILGQLDGSIPSTTAGQAEDSSALIQADFALSDMGAQGGGKGGFGNFNGFDQSAFGGDRPNFPNGQNDDRLSPPDKTNDGAESSSNSNDAQTADGQTPPDRPDNDGAAPNADGDPAAPQTSNSADAAADAPLPDGTGDSDEDPAEDATAATTPSDETGDTQQTVDSRQSRRAPNGMSFGAQSEQAVTGAPIAYAATLDGAAVVALIAALILITRRRR